MLGETSVFFSMLLAKKIFWYRQCKHLTVGQIARDFLEQYLSIRRSTPQKSLFSIRSWDSTSAANQPQQANGKLQWTFENRWPLSSFPSYFVPQVPAVPAFSALVGATAPTERSKGHCAPSLLVNGQQRGRILKLITRVHNMSQGRKPSDCSLRHDRQTWRFHRITCASPNELVTSSWTMWLA
jgi:hypothetical protein